MEHNEFIELLDKENPRYRSLSKLTKLPDHWLFARKGKDLMEVVERFRSEYREPIIDKKLQVVIGCFAHEAIRAELYRYHKAMDSLKDWPYCREDEDSDHADRYINEGMGYYFQSMSRDLPLYGLRIRPVVGHKYQPDRFDKDLFIFYDADVS